MTKLILELSTSVALPWNTTGLPVYTWLTINSSYFQSPHLYLFPEFQA
jgi:hypothetical protein